jgi:HSP20 family protein
LEKVLVCDRAGIRIEKMALAPFFGRNNRSGRIWDPFSTFHSNIFDPTEPFSIFDRPLFGRDFDGVAGTRVDWVETPEAHAFTADIPGMKKDEVKVEVLDGRTLRISGERSQDKTLEKDSWRCVERSYGKFQREFWLPENAKVEEVAAKVENGILTVTVPKEKSEPPKLRAIEVA